jgi:hypothetical protein
LAEMAEMAWKIRILAFFCHSDFLAPIQYKTPSPGWRWGRSDKFITSIVTGL